MRGGFYLAKLRKRYGVLSRERVTIFVQCKAWAQKSELRLQTASELIRGENDGTAKGKKDSGNRILTDMLSKKVKEGK